MHRVVVQQAFLVVVGMLSVLASTTTAQPIATVPEAVERYARDMDAAMRSSGPVSLETLFEEGFAAAKVLLEPGQMDRLDELTYQKVRSKMIGFLVNREERIVAAPIPDFFLKLVRERGTRADQAFFGALKRTYPDGIEPAYFNLTGDFTGCTIFDGKTLTETYGTWIAFQKSHPGQYGQAARRELAKIEGDLGLESTCVCGGEDEVRKELEGFLKAYPSSPITGKLAARLEAVKNHASGTRFNCLGGG